MWPFTNSLKCPSYKEINSLIDNLPKDRVEPRFSSSYIDRTNNIICYHYVGDWVSTWHIDVNGYTVYKYISGFSNRIEICDWEPVLLVLEKMKLKRTEAIAKLKSVT